MEDLCQYLRTTRWGQILDLARYKNTGGVKHEFLVLHARAPWGRNIWLRLDRAAGPARSGLRNKVTSQFDTKDTARIYGSEEKLRIDMAPNRVKAHVVFESPPTPLNLEKVLKIVIEESDTYTLGEQNCWFFSSVIQEILTERHSGRVKSGGLDHKSLGKEIKDRIRARLTSG